MKAITKMVEDWVKTKVSKSQSKTMVGTWNSGSEQRMVSPGETKEGHSVSTKIGYSFSLMTFNLIFSFSPDGEHCLNETTR